MLQNSHGIAHNLRLSFGFIKISKAKRSKINYGMVGRIHSHIATSPWKHQVDEKFDRDSILVEKHRYGIKSMRTDHFYIKASNDQHVNIRR